jgi:hypothetical protein
MAWLGWLALTVAGALVFLVVGFIYLAVVLAWEEQHTRGSAYYGLPLAERQRFRRRLRLHARLLLPILRLGPRITEVTLPKSSFRYKGLAGPKGSCTEESFARGHGYEPRPEDVFVVTQMKCGTTWMQHVVYQVLLRGGGDLAERGEAMYAVSPWLEGIKSVPMEQARSIGMERPARIIKTHFPADFCPFRSDARYVYVVRHPVSCFASCVDFIRANLGAFAPPVEHVRDWFCSDEDMWWGSWPRHVDGWWKLSQSRENVLFVRFEDMKRDLAGVVRAVEEHLGVSALSVEELDAIVTKCGFDYMRDHADSFEMQPPHLLAIDAELLVKGTADRYRDVPEDMRRVIMAWCSARLAEADFPLAREYPSV